jgi:hypothetical protein
MTSARARMQLQSFVRKPGPFAWFHDPAVDPIVSASYPQSRQRWRRSMRAFSGAEVNRRLLPRWVDDVIMRGRAHGPATVQKKKGFTVEPEEGAAGAGAPPGLRLPPRPPERLTAPVRPRCIACLCNAPSMMNA